MADIGVSPRNGWGFDHLERPTTDKTDGCTIVFRKGRETYGYWVKPQSDLMSSKLRSIVLSVSKGELDMPHLTGSEQEDVWSAMCKVGTVLTETDEREDTARWVEELLDATTPLRDYTLEPDGAKRYEALMALRARGEFRRPDARAFVNGNGEPWLARPIRFIDNETGEQWLRAGETIHVHPLGVWRRAVVVGGAQGAPRANRRPGEVLPAPLPTTPEGAAVPADSGAPRAPRGRSGRRARGRHRGAGDERKRTREAPLGALPLNRRLLPRAYMSNTDRLYVRVLRK